MRCTTAAYTISSRPAAGLSAVGILRFTYAAGAGCCVLLRKALAVAGAVVTGIGSQLNIT